MCFTTLLNLELTSQSKVIGFADDLMILTKGQSVVDENYMNLEVRKLLEWAINNELKFNENKSYDYVSQERGKGDGNLCKQNPKTSQQFKISWYYF